MDSATAPINEPRARSSLGKRLLANGFALLCLVWVFHDVHPRQLWAAMTISNWWFVVAAIAVDILTYILQGARWQLLLAPVGRLGTFRATQAIYAGLFTNEVLPLRVGEVVRAFLVSRWMKSGIASVLPSMLLERVLDGIWLALGIGIAAMFVPLPKDLIRAGQVLGIIVVVAIALFLVVVFRKEQELEHGAKPEAANRSRLSRIISHFAEGFREIGISSGLLMAALFSAAMLLCQILALWFMMRASGFALPLGAGCVVLLIVRLGTAIPNAPANVGSFQFFTVVGLGLFGVEKSAAAGFSVVYFVALTAPLWILGMVAISRTGMSISEIKSGVTGLRREPQPQNIP